jgi:hypothetical protein
LVKRVPSETLTIVAYKLTLMKCFWKHEEFHRLTLRYFLYIYFWHDLDEEDTWPELHLAIFTRVLIYVNYYRIDHDISLN